MNSEAVVNVRAVIVPLRPRLRMGGKSASSDQSSAQLLLNAEEISLVPNKWIVGKLSGASGSFTLVYSTQLTTSTSTTSLMYVHSAAKSWHHSDTLSCGHCHSDDWLYAVASLSLERLRW